eukprot:UN31985
MHLSYEDVLSRADLYALAATIALNVGIGNNGGGGWENVFEIFEVGRETCTDLSLEATNFPDSDLSPFSGSHDGNLQDLLDLTPNEVATLLGVHGLGKATLENSGYVNFWVDEPMGDGLLELDNQFYDGLVNRPWTQTDIPGSDELQWVIPNGAGGPPPPMGPGGPPPMGPGGPPPGPGGPPPGPGGPPPGGLPLGPDGLPGTNLMLNADVFIWKELHLNPEISGSLEIDPICRENFNRNDCDRSSETAALVQQYANDGGTEAFIADLRLVFLKMLRHGADNLATVCSVDGSDVNVPKCPDVCTLDGSCVVLENGVGESCRRNLGGGNHGPPGGPPPGPGGNHPPGPGGPGGNHPPGPGGPGGNHPPGPGGPGGMFPPPPGPPGSMPPPGPGNMPPPPPGGPGDNPGNMPPGGPVPGDNPI